MTYQQTKGKKYWYYLLKLCCHQGGTPSAQHPAFPWPYPKQFWIPVAWGEWGSPAWSGSLSWAAQGSSHASLRPRESGHPSSNPWEADLGSFSQLKTEVGQNVLTNSWQKHDSFKVNIGSRANQRNNNRQNKSLFIVIYAYWQYCFNATSLKAYFICILLSFMDNWLPFVQDKGVISFRADDTTGHVS